MGVLDHDGARLGKVSASVRCLPIRSARDLAMPGLWSAHVRIETSSFSWAPSPPAWYTPPGRTIQSFEEARSPIWPSYPLRGLAVDPAVLFRAVRRRYGLASRGTMRPFLIVAHSFAHLYQAGVAIMAGLERRNC